MQKKHQTTWLEVPPEDFIKGNLSARVPVTYFHDEPLSFREVLLKEDRELGFDSSLVEIDSGPGMPTRIYAVQNKEGRCYSVAVLVRTFPREVLAVKNLVDAEQSKRS